MAFHGYRSFYFLSEQDYFELLVYGLIASVFHMRYSFCLLGHRAVHYSLGLSHEV